MKTLVTFLSLLILTTMAKAQTQIDITANGQTKTATLSDTEAARELFALLADGPVTISMSDYGGFEKVGDLPSPLTTSNRQITTSPGDIMLYQGHSIVIFYGTNSWSYTPLGKIDDATADEIRDFLSGTNVEVTLSVSSASVSTTSSDSHTDPIIYDLNGNRVHLNGRPLSSLPKGIYIISGEKRSIN
ncbi:MAG: hypothetical protein K2H47_10300 [Muribaculaceae bacterium]|nr:hypothetical protein [Muribaculaceae bacterium]